MKKETWKDIPNYEGYYQISNHGRVKSLLRTVIKITGRKQTMPEKILSLHNDGEYLSIMMYKNNIAKRYRIHKLVALCFIKPDINRLHINHIDGNKVNNYVGNLERCTPSENGKHAVKNGFTIMPNIQGTNNGRCKLTPEQVLEIRSLNGLMTQKSIANKFNIKPAQVSTIINRKGWTHI